MRKFLFALLILVLAAGASAQQPRTISRSITVDSYRPVGEVRNWSVETRDTLVGRCISLLADRAEIDGHEGFKFETELHFDYTEIGSDLKIDIASNHFVSQEGFYLGDEMDLTVLDQTDEFKLTRDGDEVSGYFTRSGQKVERAQPLPYETFSWDDNFYDQLELYLAMRTLREGEDIVDTLFAPQPMIPVPFRAHCDTFAYVQLFKGRFDSCMIISMTEPQPHRLYFTPDKRLVKVDILGTSTKVYLDGVAAPMKGQAVGESKSSAFVAETVSRLPHYALLLVMSGLFVLLLTMKATARQINLWAFLAGAVFFLGIPLIQVPLQTWLVSSIVLPAINQGKSMIAYALLPTASGAVIQELLKVLALLGIILWRAPSAAMYPLLGAFVGAGFGLLEGWYTVSISAPIPLFGGSMLERIIVLCAQISSGVLYGASLKRGAILTTLTGLVMVAINLYFRLSPLLVQQKKITHGVFYLMTGFVATILLLIALIICIRARKARSGKKSR